MEIYKIAAQKGIRFPSNRGDLTVEQLFSLSLRSGDGFDLDIVARTINNDLKGLTEESFVEDTRSNPRKTELEVSLEIVKDVIKTKQAEQQAALNRSQKAIERKKILDAMSQKKDAALTTASLEELEQKLAALEE